MDCVFCKISKKEIPADIVYEGRETVAFKDINPKAQIHILIIPRKHIASVKEVEEDDKDLLGELIITAKNIAKEKNLDGYKLIINIGREGGQIVEHLHLHLLGGNTIELP